MKVSSNRNPLRYDDAIAVARLWIAAGGRREVELGALEPLLWRDGKLTPSDLVRGLVESGVRVTMTTNGSQLEKNAAELKTAGLSLLRISWHTTAPDRYREISGHGDYDTFYRGIEAAARVGLPISFNRVLLRGSTNDLPTQLDFICRYGMRLKLYDLMWTPEIAEVYSDTYTDWRQVVREYVLPRTRYIEHVAGEIGRGRLRYHLPGNGIVEVKLSDQVDRSSEPCSSCAHRETCLEEFGDYVRVEPELNVHFCYLRRDIGFALSDLLSMDHQGGSCLHDRLTECVGGAADSILRGSALRYIVVPYCNYNCFLPGTSISWCHKTSGDYSFPGRPFMAPTSITASGRRGLTQISRR
ncbi:MAG: molybdenum cofactor biosynthesis protein [Acidobacteria bacterium]|nr:molybdenum cofactor biosynthesis protein [Acidobacteriota bacterium]